MHVKSFVVHIVTWQNGTRCRDSVKVLSCHSHLVWPHSTATSTVLYAAIITHGAPYIPKANFLNSSILHVLVSFRKRFLWLVPVRFFFHCCGF